MNDDSSMMKNVMSIAGKTVVTLVALTTALSAATVYFASKAGQSARENIEETVTDLTEKAQDMMGQMSGKTEAPSPAA